jgi:hypothetical protein
MKIGASFYSRALFAVALVVLIATNVFVLVGVSANRSGPQESRLTLSERELGLSYRVNKENSGLSLNLSWRTLPRKRDDNYSYWRSPGWFDRQKLVELGFNVEGLSGPGGDDVYAKMPIPKEVYIVLELEGAAYRESLQRAQTRYDAAAPDELDEKKRKLRFERWDNSRLFAIDAGLDPMDLRKVYGDRKRFLIAKGVVAPRNIYAEDKEDVGGYIKRLSIEKIHVPLKLRTFFDGLPAKVASGKDEIIGPRYQAELAYGSRFEPWIVSVESFDDGTQEIEGSDDADYVGRLSWPLTPADYVGRLSRPIKLAD